MTELIIAALDGLDEGLIIGLLAMSVVMIYRSTRVLSFAQGAIASLATYVYFQLVAVWSLPVAVALPIALLAAVLIGASSERAVMRPLRSADTLTRTVATLGLVLVLQVIMRVLWGGDESFVPALATGRLQIGGAILTAQQLIIAAVSIAAASLLAAWARASYAGLALSAMAEDPAAARLLGVSPARASLLAWSMAAVLAALAGILATPTLVLNPLQMTLIMVASLGAALLGGAVSLPHALAGGVLIGVVQSITLTYVSVSGLDEAFGFIAVFAVLLLARGRRSVLTQQGAGV